MAKTSFAAVAQRWALASTREAHENWRAGNWHGAVTEIWNVEDLARRCAWEYASTMLQEMVVAMLRQDSEYVAHCRHELEIYLGGLL